MITDQQIRRLRMLINIPKDDPGYTTRWLARGRGRYPPYEPGAEAQRALNLPKHNSGDAVRQVKINPAEKIAGPRTPGPQPDEGWPDPGTGQEYYRGPNFPP